VPLCAAQKLIAILDISQEFRLLSTSEILLCRDLKAKLLGLTAIEKLRAKQASRLTSVRAAEASEKLFFLQANGRKRKNTIHLLETPRGGGGLLHAPGKGGGSVSPLQYSFQHAGA
jgi:hypothetical protein